jgi:Transposase
MQGKEASEQETKAKSSVGIDVSKCWLDICVLPAEQRLRVLNSCAGIRQLKRWLERFDIVLIVIEATGKWHRHLHRSLVASAIPVAVADPFRVRMFAKAQGIFAKTDRLDARVLAMFAAMMTPSLRAPASQVMAELAELVAARANAVEAQAALKNQLCTAESKSQTSAPAAPCQSRQGYRRTRRRDSQAHRGRRWPGQALRHPHFDPGYGVCCCHNHHRLARRDRQLDRQAGRHARRPRPDRKSIGRARWRSRHLGRTTCRAPCSLSRSPQRHSLQCRHEGLLPASQGQRKATESRPYRRR